MDNKRKKSRLFPTTQMIVFDTNSGKLLGNIADFSPEGMMLICTDPIPVNEVFYLQVKVPIFHHTPSETQITGSEKGIYIEAKAVWCERDKFAKELYNTGFRFISASQDDVEYMVNLHGCQVEL